VVSALLLRLKSQGSDGQPKLKWLEVGERTVGTKLRCYSRVSLLTK
jgi:hypothetical protein